MKGRCCRILLPAVLVASALAQDAVFPVAGVVVDGLGGDTLKRVRVAIAPSDSVQSELATMVTGSDGRFHFTLPKGKYKLTAERRGLPPQSFGSHSLGSGFGVAIVVDSDQRTDNLVFRILPPAAITGRVVDDAGEPVEGALVQLLGSSVVGGRKRVGPRGYFYTDDLGNFRFGPLPAGTYYLAVTGKPWYSEAGPLPAALAAQSHPGAALDRLIAYAPVYYPNSSDPRGAAPLVLKPGEEFIANIKLYAVPGVNILVRCDGAAPASPTPGNPPKMEHKRLQLIADGVQGVDSFARVQDFYGQQMTIWAVTPGHYKVRVTGLDQESPPRGSQTVDVVSADVEVTIALKQPVTVTGTVQLESRDAKPMGRLLVSLREETTNAAYSRALSADGSFRIPNVMSGKYRVFVAGVAGVFAKGVLEDGSLRDGLVEVGGESDRSLKIVASSGFGRVKGFVYRAGQPVAGVMVAMIPENQTNDPIYYRGFQTDSDGSFDFQNVPPGDYRIFAVDDVELEYANPVAMRPYRQSGKPIKVEAQSSYTENIDIP